MARSPLESGSLTRSLVHHSGRMRRLLRERLWLQVLIGMAGGLVCGTLIDPDLGLVSPAASRGIVGWLVLPGQLFLALIGFVVVPLVLASVVRGIAAGERGESLGRIGTETIVFFVATTVLACVIGFAVAGIVKPGALIDGQALMASAGSEAQRMAETAAQAAEQAQADKPAVGARIVALLPANPLRALADGDMLQVVIVSAILGLALLRVDRKTAQPLLDLMAALQAITMVIVQVALRFAPVAVFGLMARLAADLGLDAVAGLAAYVGSVVLGLALLLAVYLALAWWIGGQGPGAFLKTTREALLLAFSTSSSAAVMPVSLRTAEQALGVRQAVARFVIPLGATVNMGGTALYQAVAAVFLAQIFGVALGPDELALILVMAVGAAIGSPGTPGVGIVILATILESVGIPAAGIALVIGVDRILDMCRTVINVAGDLTAALVIDARRRRAATATYPEPGPQTPPAG